LFCRGCAACRTTSGDEKLYEEINMMKAVRLLILYVVGMVLLSSVDVTYEWLSPLRNGADAWSAP
jgi:hypothetical protein